MALTAREEELKKKSLEYAKQREAVKQGINSRVIANAQKHSSPTPAQVDAAAQATMSQNRSAPQPGALSGSLMERATGAATVGRQNVLNMSRPSVQTPTSGIYNNTARRIDRLQNRMQSNTQGDTAERIRSLEQQAINYSNAGMTEQMLQTQKELDELKQSSDQGKLDALKTQRAEEKAAAWQAEQNKRMQDYVNLQAEEDFSALAGQGMDASGWSKEELDKRISETDAEISRLIASGQFEEADEKKKELDSLYKMQSMGKYGEDAERSTYSYLLAKDAQTGGNEAQEYLKFMENTMNYRQGKEQAEKIQGIESDALRTLAIGAHSIGTGMANAGSGFNQLLNGDEPIATTPMQYASQEIQEDLGKVGKTLYSAGTSVGNMLPSILLSAVSGGLGASAAVAGGIGAAAMGASSAGNVYTQAVQEGYSPEQAKTYAALVGASEATLQYLLGGIGKLGGVTDDVLLAKVSKLDNALARVAATGAVKLGSEIGEEELQLYLEPLIKSVVFGEEYKKPGFDEVLETALVTALSTGALEGKAILSAGKNTNAPQQMQTNTPNEDMVAKMAQDLAGTNKNAQTETARAIIADTTRFDNKVLNNLNEARTRFVEYAKAHFPATVINKETGKTIGISRKGIDKFLSGRIPREKYASGFHIPELIERAHIIGDATNYHADKVSDIPTYEYYDSPIEIDGRSFTAHIRVRNTMSGDKYYGHTISEVDEIRIEPSSARTSADGTSTVQPVDKAGDSSVNIIFDSPENVNGSVGAADSGFDPYSHASNTYGAIEPGENPARVVDVPKSMDGETNVKQTVRTILEADVTTDKAIPDLEREIVKGGFSAMPITDRAAADNAEATIRRVGYTQALADWRAEVRDGKVSKYSIAMGETLYNAAVSAGDTKSAVKIAVEFATQVRSAAQALQAVRMLKKMSPAAQLYGVKQSVDNLQQQLQKQYGDRAPGLVINETLAANFIEAQTDADRTAAEEALYKDIARQIPATFSDKWNAWRYLSMLGNPRTHIRNIVGNAAFAPVRGAKNQLGGLIEAIAQRAGVIDKSQRTKSVGFNWSQKRQALVQAAKADYANVQGQIQSGDKYNSATNIIDQNRRIFDNAFLETIRRGNSAALDLEDQWFSKGAYASSLAGYLNARDYTAEDFTGNGMTDKQKDDARAYAILEAQKATYRDLNALSELVTSVKFKNPADSKTKGGEMAKRAANTVVEGVLPFKKTPANILARAMEYSPAGLAKALTVDAVQVANGRITAAEYMDHLASGLTGTGLFALGYALSNSGLLVGGSPEDEEQFDLEGRQPYSLEIGGKSITLDWLAPEALPVFMGVELAEAITEYGGEAVSMDTMKSVFRGITGPVLEMSMMSGLQDALDAVSYADDKMSAIVANAALGYLGQAVPTLFGQMERIIGTNAETRQTTFTQKGKFLDTDTQYTLGSTLNKVPFLDFQQIPYIDAWGRTESTGSVGERAANNLLNPAYVSDLQETPVDTEIKRLEQATGENLTPSRAEKVLTVDGEKVFLTADEYVTYATAKGQNDYTFRENLISSERYTGLDDATKVKAMEYAKSYADALAREETGLNADKTDWMKELDGADIDTATQMFVEKAIESMAGSSQYDNKYDGLSQMLEAGNVDDAIALALMPDAAVDAYNQRLSGKDISVGEWVDVYGRVNSLGGDEKKNDALAYIGGLDKTPAQKTAFAQALYKDIPYDWLLDIGADDSAITSQFSTSQRGLYNQYIKGTGIDMGDYLDIRSYRYGSGDEIKHDQEEVVAKIKSSGYSQDDQIRIFLSIGYSENSVKKFWK